MSLDEYKSLLKDVDIEKAFFKEHFYERSLDRYLTTDFVRRAMKDYALLVSADEQPAKSVGERKFRVKLKISSKYYLSLVVVFSKKDLYIITGWRSLR